MMNLKATTKNYSEGPSSGLRDSGPKKQFNAAGKKEDVLKGRDIGTYLNQVADPSWVDPAKMRQVGGDKLDKEAFLKLMLAQIKNQDPMNPLKSHETAAQLAQFSQLEQLTNLNDAVGELAEAQKPQNNFQALNFIGKTVSVDSSEIVRSKGDNQHEIRFNVPRDAEKVTTKIYSPSGDVIRTIESESLKKGSHKVTWGGNTDKAGLAPEGQYRVEIVGEDAKGSKIPVHTSFKGQVTGVNYTPLGPVLMVGDQSFKVSDITKIESSELKALQQSSEAKKTSTDVKNTNEGGLKAVEGGAPAAKTSKIDDIPMASALKNKIAQAIEEEK